MLRRQERLKKVGHEGKEKVKEDIQEQHTIMGDKVEQHPVSEAASSDDVSRSFVTKPDRRGIELSLYSL